MGLMESSDSSAFGHDPMVQFDLGADEDFLGEPDHRVSADQAEVFHAMAREEEQRLGHDLTSVELARLDRAADTMINFSSTGEDYAA